MSGGGKGGSQTTQVQIPEWMSNAAKQNLARADRVAQLDFMPYFGPDVAAMTPMQEAAMENTNQAALSFGMAAPTSAMAGIPMAQTFAGGVRGFSSAPLYQESVRALETAMPGAVAARNAMFIDPITGAQPMYPFGTAAAPAPAPGPQGFDWARGGGGGGGGGMSMGGGGTSAPRTGGGTGSFGLPDPMSGAFAGTNFPGVGGSVVNRLTRALAPAPAAPAPLVRPAPAPARPASTSKPAPRASSGRRR